MLRFSILLKWPDKIFSILDARTGLVRSGRSTVDGGEWRIVLVAGVGICMWTYTCMSSILLRIITVNIEGVTQIMK